MIEEKCPQLLAAALEIGPFGWEAISALRLVSRQTKHLVDQCVQMLSLRNTDLDYVDRESPLLDKVVALFSNPTLEGDFIEVDKCSIEKLFSLPLPNLRDVSLPDIKFDSYDACCNLFWPEVTKLAYYKSLGSSSLKKFLLGGKLPRLKQLSIPGGMFFKRDGEEFAAAFTQLTYLDLYATDYGGLEWLVKGLPMLKELHVSDKVDSLGELAAASSTDITHIEISGDLSIEDAQRLTTAPWLKHLRVWETLDCDIENEIALNTLLTSFEAIETLSIGTVDVNSMLGFRNVVLPSLRKLRLTGLHAEWDEALEALCAASLPRLQSLDIKLVSDFDPSPACDFQGLTPHTWPNLVDITLERLGITLEGMRKIAPYVPRLKHLTLNAARLDDACAEALAEGFPPAGSCSSPLESFLMINNHNTDNGFKNIFEASVRSAPLIRKLDFSSNPMGIESGMLLARAEKDGAWRDLEDIHFPQLGIQGLAMLATMHITKWPLQSLWMDKMEEMVNLETQAALWQVYPDAHTLVFMFWPR